jgi:hypothetical protein
MSYFCTTPPNYAGISNKQKPQSEYADSAENHTKPHRYLRPGHQEYDRPE